MTNADVRMRLGLYLAESRKDPARAVALLSDLPADDAEAMNALGIACTAAGRHDEAIAAFKRVLAVDPENGLALQNIAAIKLGQGAVSEAESLARQANQRVHLIGWSFDGYLARELARLGPTPDSAARRKALAAFCKVVLNLNEFIYID